MQNQRHSRKGGIEYSTKISKIPTDVSEQVIYLFLFQPVPIVNYEDMTGAFLSSLLRGLDCIVTSGFACLNEDDRGGHGVVGSRSIAGARVRRSPVSAG